MELIDAYLILFNLSNLNSNKKKLQYQRDYIVVYIIFKLIKYFLFLSPKK